MSNALLYISLSACLLAGAYLAGYSHAVRQKRHAYTRETERLLSETQASRAKAVGLDATIKTTGVMVQTASRRTQAGKYNVEDSALTPGQAEALPLPAQAERSALLDLVNAQQTELNLLKTMVSELTISRDLWSGIAEKERLRCMALEIQIDAIKADDMATRIKIGALSVGLGAITGYIAAR